MNFRLLKKLPLLVSAFCCVITCVLELAVDRFRVLAPLRRLEWISYDMRVRRAAASQPRSDALAVVRIDDESLAIEEKKLRVRWPWPRWVHGVVLQELTAQGARGVAYDVFFLEPRPNDFAPTKAGAKPVSSDLYFAQEIRQHGNVLLSAPPDDFQKEHLRLPAEPLLSAAAAIGHARRTVDGDGIVRRVEPLVNDPKHGRIWLTGIHLAASQLGWDLDKASIDPWRIMVPDKEGKPHVIPLDGEGRMVLRWARGSADANDLSDISHETNVAAALGMAAHRRTNPGNPPSVYRDKAVVIGSSGANALIRDFAPTALSKETALYWVHWNAANSLLTGAYVRTLGWPGRIAFAVGMVCITGVVTWRLRAFWALLAVLALGVMYGAVCLWAYSAHGLWLPFAIPIIGGVLATHALSTLFRHIIEHAHRRRLRGLFEHLISPDALELLMQQPNVSWAPEDRELTVFFADIRGFTTLSDQESQPPAGEQPDNTRGEPLLQTVNTYLAPVADVLKRHGATIDKYMGDSVMAFWGAPLAQPDHAARAVRAAIECQQTIAAINEQRTALNKTGGASVPVLSMGTGISTGVMTVGFMGSSQHLSNYTVLGREVNVASRLEGASGNGRIYISQRTAEAATRQAPELVECIERVGPVQLKGITEAVEVSMVRWQPQPN